MWTSIAYAGTGSLALTSACVSVLLIVGALWYRRTVRKVPGAFQAVVEGLVSTIFDRAERTVGNRTVAVRSTLAPMVILLLMIGSLALSCTPGLSAVAFGYTEAGAPLRFTPLAAHTAVWLAYAGILFCATEYTLVRTLSWRAYGIRLLTLRIVLDWVVGIVRAVRTALIGAYRASSTACSALRWRSVLMLAVLAVPATFPGTLPVLTALAGVGGAVLLMVVGVQTVATALRGIR